jgi:biopolymer transport protein ExbD
MRIKKRHEQAKDADLDITSFMNLMIILVPVLLMGMVLSRTTVLDLKLPDVNSGISSDSQEPIAQLELVIRPDYVDINYPAGIKLKRIEKTSTGDYDYVLLSNTLQEIKRQLEDQGKPKKDIYVLSEKNTPYQAIVAVMDTARSFEAVVAASVVNAELFPEISLGDAPPLSEQPQAVAAPAAGAQ